MQPRQLIFLCGDIDVFRACIGRQSEQGYLRCTVFKQYWSRRMRMARRRVAQRVKCNIIDKDLESPLFAAKGYSHTREPCV